MRIAYFIDPVGNCLARVFLLLSLLQSCQPATVADKKTAVANTGWARDDKLVVMFTIKESNQPYNLQLSLTNTLQYPYRNIHILYELVDSNGKTLAQDVVDYNVFALTGEPLGRQDGNYQHHNYTLLPNYIFPAPGSYQLSILQYMRPEQLVGVTRLQAKVCKAHPVGILA